MIQVNEVKRREHRGRSSADWIKKEFFGCKIKAPYENRTLTSKKGSGPQKDKLPFGQLEISLSVSKGKPKMVVFDQPGLLYKQKDASARNKL
jgi:hypothetical protein